jgi:hypothetical protein
VHLPLLAQQAGPVTDGLLQYGAVGILAVVGLVAVWILWKRIDKIYDEIYDSERERADRLEKELRELNKLITGEFSGLLVRCAEVLREVTEMLRHRDRGDR